MNKDILLVDFDILMNFDYAIIRVIREKYNGTDITKDLSNLYMEDLYELLENREDVNPLSIIIDEKYKSSYDNLLKELYEKELDSIYSNLIVNTNIHTVVDACNKNKMVEVTIYCKNETEEQIIKKLFGYNTVLDKDVNYNDYDTFMIHYKSRILEYPSRYYGKCVYMAMTHYNLFYMESHKCYVLPEDILYVCMNKINLKLIGLFNIKNVEEKHYDQL